MSDFEIVENSSASCTDENGHWHNLIIISHNPPRCEKLDSPAPGVHAGSPMFTDFIKKVYLQELQQDPLYGLP